MTIGQNDLAGEDGEERKVCIYVCNFDVSVLVFVFVFLLVFVFV